MDLGRADFWGWCLVQLERFVQGADGEFCVFAVDQDGDFDFRCGDDFDIDVLVREGFEHGLRDTRMGAHADADNGDFRDIRVGFDAGKTDLFLGAFQGCQRFVEVTLADREGQIGGIVRAGNTLHDHVDDDIGVGHGAADFGDHAGRIFQFEQCDLGFVA